MGLGAAPTTRNWKLLSLPEFSAAMDGLESVSGGKMLSNGTMEFFDAAEDKGGFVEILAVLFKEHHEDLLPDLQKCAMRIYFFKKCNLATATGADFVFTTELLDALQGYVDIETTDWVELEGGKEAFVRINTSLVIKLDEDLQVIQSIAVATGTGEFSSNHTLTPELIVAE